MFDHSIYTKRIRGSGLYILYLVTGVIKKFQKMRVKEKNETNVHAAEYIIQTTS